MQVKFDRASGIRLGTVLDKFLSQVSAGFLVKPDHISILPRNRLQAAVWEANQITPNGNERPKLPLVHAVFTEKELDAALKELADQSGVSIVLDRRRARTGDQASAAITASLINAPLDTAFAILANQAELESVLLDNVLYVTTPENAVAFKKGLKAWLNAEN
jgi:hypothetical protein